MNPSSASLRHGAVPARVRATYQDILDAPAHRVAEIVDGTLHTHPRPASPDARAGSALAVKLGGPFDYDACGPGGWWIVFEAELHRRHAVVAGRVHAGILCRRCRPCGCMTDPGIGRRSGAGAKATCGRVRRWSRAGSACSMTGASAGLSMGPIDRGGVGTPYQSATISIWWGSKTSPKRAGTPPFGFPASLRIRARSRAI